MLSLEQVKRNIGIKAAELIQDGMVVGLGTGSTAKYLIDALAQRLREGLSIKVVATSKASEAQAKAAGFTFADISAITSVDLTLDGADEITPDLQMIKGKGGALLREKIIATMSTEMVALVDETKLCETLGKAMLPVEIVPFGRASTLAQIEALGLKGGWRLERDELYMTDGGHLIADFEGVEGKEARELQKAITQIPGVVETGFFFDIAKRIVVGCLDGSVRDKF